MSYVIPTNELTLTDIKGFRGAAVDAGVDRAMALGLARGREELVAREAHPHTDFGATWGDENYIEGAGPAAIGWQLVGDAVPVAPSQLGNNKIAVFYKVANSDEAPLITAVRFRVGFTGATTRGSFFIQLPIDIKLEPEAYFTEPIVYSPQEWVYIEAYYSAAAAPAGEELIFGCFIVEPTGGTVS